MKAAHHEVIWPQGLVRAIALGAWLAAGCVLPATAQTQPAALEPAPETAPALAPEPGASMPPIEESGWKYELTPYLWLSGLQGDVQGGRLPKTSVDMSFSDIFKVLDFAAMGTLEVRKQRWGWLFDAMYIKASDSATSSRTTPQGAQRSASAEITLKQTILAAAAAYRVSEGPTLVDLIGGARYTKIDADATIAASLFAPDGQSVAGTTSRSGEKSWVDAYLGVRVQQPVGERWTLDGYFDAGGGKHDYTWQALAGASYRFSKSLSGKFGYRYLYVDYRKDQFVYDLATKGFYLGLGIAF
jgi:opacity protein-like surface antigen